MTTDLEKLFNDVRQNEIKKEEEKTSVSIDPRFIKIEAGNKYVFRLLFIPNKSVDRKVPFFYKSTHSYYDAENKEFHWVTCPTSEYLLDNAGFKKCRVCQKLGDFWKAAQDGSEVDKEAYDTFKRRKNCYAYVYVLKDTVTPENVGKVRVLRLPRSGYLYLRSKIYGIIETKKKNDNEKNNNINDELDDTVIGIDAFKIKDGFNFYMNVDEGEYGNSYIFDFARKATSLKCTDADIVKKFKTDLKHETEGTHFDEEYYTDYDVDSINDFYDKFVEGNSIEQVSNTIQPDQAMVNALESDENEIDISIESENEIEDEIPMNFNDDIKEEETILDNKSETNEEIDVNNIDEFLNGLED